MKKEQGPDHSPRSAREIRKAIRGIPREVVEQAVQEGEEELRREVAEMEDRRRREWHNYVPHPFTL